MSDIKKKLTKSRLRQLVREEVQNVMSNMNEVNKIPPSGGRYGPEDIGSYVFLVKVPQEDAEAAEDVLFDLDHIVKTDYPGERGGWHVFVFDDRVEAKDAQYDLEQSGFRTQIDLGS